MHCTFERRRGEYHKLTKSDHTECYLEQNTSNLSESLLIKPETLQTRYIDTTHKSLLIILCNGVQNMHIVPRSENTDTLNDFFIYYYSSICHIRSETLNKGGHKIAFCLRPLLYIKLLYIVRCTEDTTLLSESYNKSTK